MINAKAIGRHLGGHKLIAMSPTFVDGHKREQILRSLEKTSQARASSMPRNTKDQTIPNPREPGRGVAKNKRPFSQGQLKHPQNYKKQGLPWVPPRKAPPGVPPQGPGDNADEHVAGSAAGAAEERARTRSRGRTGHRRKKGVALPLRRELTPDVLGKTWATSRAQGRGTPCTLPPRLARPPRP